MATATWKDTVIADTEDASVVVDGNIYFPKDDLNMEFFSQSEHTSVVSEWPPRAYNARGATTSCSGLHARLSCPAMSPNRALLPMSRDFPMSSGEEGRASRDFPVPPRGRGSPLRTPEE